MRREKGDPYCRYEFICCRKVRKRDRGQGRNSDWVRGGKAFQEREKEKRDINCFGRLTTKHRFVLGCRKKGEEKDNDNGTGEAGLGGPGGSIRGFCSKQSNARQIAED